jgi:hypothetical protein
MLIVHTWKRVDEKINLLVSNAILSGVLAPADELISSFALQVFSEKKGCLKSIFLLSH